MADKLPTPMKINNFPNLPSDPDFDEFFYKAVFLAVSVIALIAFLCLKN